MISRKIRALENFIDFHSVEWEAWAWARTCGNLLSPFVRKNYVKSKYIHMYISVNQTVFKKYFSSESKVRILSNCGLACKIMVHLLKMVRDKHLFTRNGFCNFPFLIRKQFQANELLSNLSILMRISPRMTFPLMVMTSGKIWKFVGMITDLMQQTFSPGDLRNLFKITMLRNPYFCTFLI